MSVTCGFYNSVNHDRRYNAKHISSIFDGIINDGVFMNIGDALAVTANFGMTVNVGIGRAWFNHSWTYNDSILPLAVPASHSVLDRIDAVVLEVNESDDVRNNTIKIVSGTTSSTPVKPTLINTEFVHQHPLAYIAVKGGVTEITQANITNNVGMSDCPYITGILKTISAEVLFKQWDREFSEWFENVKTQLSGDVAGNLQNQIGTLPALKTAIKSNLVEALNSIVSKLGSEDISKIGDGTVTGAILSHNQSLTLLNEGKEPVKNVYGSWNSEQSNEVTIDTSGLRDGAYIIFNSYAVEKPLVEFIVKFQGSIATTNLSMASSINGDKITYSCGSFWCMFFAKMIEPLG